MTETSEGTIKNRKWRGVSLVVKLDIQNERGKAALMNTPFPPKRRSGHLVYAIPGGGEIEEWRIDASDQAVRPT
tara:strand:+ start:145 stop:366 length:222 start_codon:yes stop_codon:yes gene_type:complete